MIALRVTDVVALNTLARDRMHTAGMLTGPQITAAGRAFQVDDRVIARRNRNLATAAGAAAPVMNGHRGTIAAVDPQQRTVSVAWDERSITGVPAAYLDAGHLDHGYAITGHRAQGLTFDRTWIDTSDAMYREWGYVATSRGRRHNQLYITAHLATATATELDHGAWQQVDANATQRLRDQTSRSRAHSTATDTCHRRMPPHDLGLP